MLYRLIDWLRDCIKNDVPISNLHTIRLVIHALKIGRYTKARRLLKEYYPDAPKELKDSLQVIELGHVYKVDSHKKLANTVIRKLEEALNRHRR